MTITELLKQLENIAKKLEYLTEELGIQIEEIEGVLADEIEKERK